MASPRGNRPISRPWIKMVRPATTSRTPVQGYLATVGRYFAIHEYSTVNSAIERIKAPKIYDQPLQNHLKKLEKLLAKSQKEI